jgi:hypothetical protein
MRRKKGFALASIALGALGALASSCAPRAPSPPTTTTANTAKTVASAPTPGPTTFSVPRPDPSKPPTIFKVLAPLRFKPAKGAAKMKLLHPQREHVVMSPDGTTMLASFGNHATIFSNAPGAPKKGVDVDVADVFETAFSNDGAFVAVTQARDSLTVFGLPKGDVVWHSNVGAECAPVFVGSTLMFHFQSWTGPGYGPGRLWRVTIPPTSPKIEATPIGPERIANRCWADPSGRWWIVTDDNGKPHTTTVVDGATGLGAPWLSDDDPIGSPIADRACFPVEKEGYRCAKMGETALEVLGPPGDPNSWLGLVFDDTGKRALYTLVHETSTGDGIDQATYVADFDAQTVQRVIGPGLRSGGVIKLLSGGRVIAAGSASGVEIWDLDAGTSMKIPGNAFYGVDPVFGVPRSLFVFEEDGGGWKAYRADL